MDPTALCTYFRSRQTDILTTIGQLVTHETPSTDKPQLDAFAALLAERYAAAGATVEVLANPTHGNHVRATFHHGETAAQPALVLCHYDTVWPVGSLATHPLRVEDGKAYGPGIYDMQSSLALVEYALRAVADLDLRLPRPITVLVTSDEEIGSGTSRALIEAEAQRAAYVLVMEPPLVNGALKTARKGTGTFVVETIGRAAHAGVDPYKGVNAIEELARHIPALHALGDREQGTTVSVGVIQGGTATNVIPAHCVAQVDVRAWTQAEADRIERSMHEPAAHPAGRPGAGERGLEPAAAGTNSDSSPLRPGAGHRRDLGLRSARGQHRRRQRRQFHRRAGHSHARRPRRPRRRRPRGSRAHSGGRAR